MSWKTETLTPADRRHHRRGTARSRGNIASGFTAAERSENESAVIIRRTRKGDYAITDDRDLYELEANRAARRRRARIPAIIPGDVVDAAVERCRRTLDASVGDLKDARNKTVESFGVFGVSKEMPERRIGRRIDAIRPGGIVVLRGIFNSLKEGTATASEFFEAVKKPEDIIPQAAPPPPAATRQAAPPATVGESPETTFPKPAKRKSAPPLPPTNGT
jgi:hypothetical protein